MDTENQKHFENGAIVVDLKKQSRKQIRRFRRNREGRLADTIQETLETLKSSGKLAANVQPVVFVVRQKRSRARNLFF